MEVHRAALLAAPPHLLRAQPPLYLGLLTDAPMGDRGKVTMTSLPVIGLLVQVAALLSVFALHAYLVPFLGLQGKVGCCSSTPPPAAGLGAVSPLLPLGPLGSEALHAAVADLGALATIPPPSCPGSRPGGRACWSRSRGSRGWWQGLADLSRAYNGESL